MSKERHLELVEFVKKQGLHCSRCYPCDCGNDCAGSLNPLNGDASFRRYYRLKQSDISINVLLKKLNKTLNISPRKSSLIVVDAPPQTQKNKEFFNINHLLHDIDILVPCIIAADLDNGFMILEDLGGKSFFDAILDEEERLAFYFKALTQMLKITLTPWTKEQMSELAKLQSEQDSVGSALIPSYHLDDSDFKVLDELPPFDEDFIRMELSIFTEWLLDKELKLTLSDDENEMLKRSFDFIVKSMLKQKVVPMHRDFHSRNIMVVPETCDSSIQAKLAVIDYQDMVKGPLMYDAASLLYDCYYVLPNDERDMLIAHIERVLKLAHVVSDDDDVKAMIRMCAIERHIKVLGLFIRLNLRDGKSGYLKDLPRVLDYVLENLSYFEELHDLKAFLESKVKGRI